MKNSIFGIKKSLRNSSFRKLHLYRFWTKFYSNFSLPAACRASSWRTRSSEKLTSVRKCWRFWGRFIHDERILLLRGMCAASRDNYSHKRWTWDDMAVSLKFAWQFHRKTSRFALISLANNLIPLGNFWKQFYAFIEQIPLGIWIPGARTEDSVFSAPTWIDSRCMRKSSENLRPGNPIRGVADGSAEWGVCSSRKSGQWPFGRNFQNVNSGD
jgi:hypothetical protein